MSWLSTAAAAFEVDELDGSEFFTWLSCLDSFDEEPLWSELEVLAQHLGWDILDLIAFHQDPLPLPAPSTIFYMKAEQ